jgi:hypothetical protein
MYNTKKSNKYIQEPHVCVNNCLYNITIIFIIVKIIYWSCTPRLLYFHMSTINCTIHSWNAFNPFKFHLHQIQIFIVRPFNKMWRLDYHGTYKPPHSFRKIAVKLQINQQLWEHSHRWVTSSMILQLLLYFQFSSHKFLLQKNKGGVYKIII